MPYERQSPPFCSGVSEELRHVAVCVDEVGIESVHLSSELTNAHLPRGRVLAELEWIQSFLETLNAHVRCLNLSLENLILQGAVAWQDDGWLEAGAVEAVQDIEQTLLRAANLTDRGDVKDPVWSLRFTHAKIID